jgi:outer membrane protein assembly factor BamA
VGLWIYNGLVNKQKSGVNKWLFNTFGSTPITISKVSPAIRAKVATNTLQNYGYFHGAVDYTIVEQKNPRKQKIAYEINLGEPYLWDSIRYMFPAIEDSIVQANLSERYIERGGQFSVVDLMSEKTRLVNDFRDNGFYYYRPDYVSYLADSLQNSGKVQLLVTANKDMPDIAKKQWRIGDISTFIRNNTSTLRRVSASAPMRPDSLRRDSSYVSANTQARGAGMRGLYSDTVDIQGLKIAYTGDKIPIKPKVMFRNFRFWKNQLFNQSKVDATMTNLNSMQVFSQVQFSFTPRDTTDTCSILDVRLDATMDKLLEAEVEFNVTQKSNSQVGPHLVLGFSKRNAFNHGETFSVKLKGSYEWQTQRSMGKSSTIDSYEYGIETSLSYPWLAFPGLKDRNFRYPTSSMFKL